MLQGSGAAESVGQRAAKFLDLVLEAAANPEQVEALWQMDGDQEAVRQSADFRALREAVAEMAEEMEHHYGDAEQLDRQLLRALAALKEYAEKSKEPGRMAGALDALEERLGAGYYQFEFRRRLRALRGGTEDAS